MGILSSIANALGGGRGYRRPTIGADYGRSPGFGRPAPSQRRRPSGLGGALLGGLIGGSVASRGRGGATGRRTAGGRRTMGGGF